MNDLWKNNRQLLSLLLPANKMIDSHCTLSSTNIYICSISSLDKHNFTYSGIINLNYCWNNI